MYTGTFQKYYKTCHYDQQEILGYGKTFFITNKRVITSHEILLKQGDDVINN